MTPILATTAASVAGDIVHTIADRIASATAKTAAPETAAVPFSAIIDRTQSAAATTLHATQRSQELSTKLLHSSDVAGAANVAGAAGPVSIQVEPNGDTNLRLPDGSLKPVQLSEENRGLARELYQLRQSPTQALPTAAMPQTHLARPVVITAA